MAPKPTKTTRAVKPARTSKTNAKATTRTKPSAPRQGKPIFRPATWIAVILFAAAIGAVVYMNRQAEETVVAEVTPEAEETFLFAQEDIVTSIEVKPLEGETVALERNAENAWELTQPTEAEADQGFSEAAASQIAALRIITELDNTTDPSNYGFDEPAYVITFGFEGGKTSTLEVGDLTPSGSGYYVRVDGDKFYITALSGIDALANLATTPPYLNTPTATSAPLPTETPAPATEASPTP